MSARLTARRSASSSAERSPPARAVQPLVLLDTNILLLPFTGGFPLESEIDRLAPGRTVAVPSSTLGELDRLAARGVAYARAARQFASRFSVIWTSARGDQAVLALARKDGHWVVTSDRVLRERLRSVGVTVLVPSGHRKLAVFRALRPATAASDRRPRATVIPRSTSKTIRQHR